MNQRKKIAHFLFVCFLMGCESEAAAADIEVMAKPVSLFAK